MLLEEKAPALRGTFLIDRDGVSRPGRVHNEGSARNTDEMPRVLPAQGPASDARWTGLRVRRLSDRKAGSLGSAWAQATASESGRWR